MFRVEHNVPDVYTQESRDFQLFSRLYDLVLQASRNSIDSMEVASDTERCNNVLLPLLGSKVGIFGNFQDAPDFALRLIFSAFPHIVRAKGSLRALRLTANVCSRIVGGSVDVNVSFEDPYTLYVDFEKPLQYMTIFTTLIEYIRPAGCAIKYRLSTSRDLSVNEPDFRLKTATDVDQWSDSSINIATTTATFKNTVGFTKVAVVEEEI